jgi:hypothetical protein
MTGDGVSDRVRRTKDLIAFAIFVLGSLVQLFRTVLCLLIFSSVMFVICSPSSLI